MRIDLTNYENFLIDYLDGKLTPAVEKEVLAFLENHPEIKEEFEGLNAISFQTESTSFDVAFLHKPQFADVKEHYEPLLVAGLEGDLNIADQLILQEGFIRYPELHREQQLFAQTIFVPEKSLSFPDKSSLRKGNVFVLYRQTITKVAAILLVTALIGIIWLRFNREAIPQLAQVSTSQNSQSSHPKETNTIPSVQPAQQTLSGKIQPSYAMSVQQSGGIRSRHLATAILIEPKQQMDFAPTRGIEAPSLSKLNAPLKYAEPVLKEAYFVSLPEYLKDKLASETRQLEQKTKTTIQEMNKTAGISIQKDSSGRITHFGIDALGFAWSQSK